MYYVEDYRKAMRQGQRNYRECVSKGIYPYLQVLDDLLKQVDVEYEQPIGVVEIPADRIVGTKAKGRRAAFSRSFMPLLKDCLLYTSGLVPSGAAAAGAGGGRRGCAGYLDPRHQSPGKSPSDCRHQHGG